MKGKKKPVIRKKSSRLLTSLRATASVAQPDKALEQQQEAVLRHPQPLLLLLLRRSKRRMWRSCLAVAVVIMGKGTQETQRKKKGGYTVHSLRRLFIRLSAQVAQGRLDRRRRDSSRRGWRISRQTIRAFSARFLQLLLGLRCLLLPPPRRRSIVAVPEKFQLRHPSSSPLLRLHR